MVGWLSWCFVFGFVEGACGYWRILDRKVRQTARQLFLIYRSASTTHHHRSLDIFVPTIIPTEPSLLHHDIYYSILIINSV